MGKPRVDGISDEVTTCECCGRTNLRRTVALSLDGESDPVYFGRDCAARALRGVGHRVAGKDIEGRATEVDRLQRELNQVAAALVRVEDMLSAGHVRYVIGGRAIGARLADLQADYLRRVDHLQRKLSSTSSL